MADQSDVREVNTQEGTAKPKRRFNATDWRQIAEYVIETWTDRKNRRATLERQWKEIDRQLAMDPDITFKMIDNGSGGRVVDQSKLWMAEMELPLQAQSLETLGADVDRFRFSGNNWFKAHAEMTDEYLERVDFQSLILGDENDVPTQINQDNADKLVEGFLNFHMRQYDFTDRMALADAEALKYSMGVARGRREAKNIYIHTSRGVRKDTKRIPVFVPVSIKKTYLDDTPPSMHSSQVLGEAHIMEDHMRLEDLILAANKGSSDPDDEDGGWMPAQLKGIEADDNGMVCVLEMEGDIVVPRKTTRSVVIPGAIVTVVKGTDSTGSTVKHGVVRFRFRQMPMSSYLLFPYQQEHIDSIYSTSPLMKGRPLQMSAADALNRLMDSAALKTQPPVGYGRDDMTFAKSGGPVIHPGAKWETTEPVQVYDEIGGDPNALAAVYRQAIELYQEALGTQPARMGAQTVSHTTAFAKDAELQRGAVRTVKYAKTSGQNTLTRWLDMAYQLGRDGLTANEKVAFWIDAYGGYVEIQKKDLPDKANFEYFGAGGTQNEQAQMQAKLNSAQLAVQLDQLKMAQGQQPTLDLDALIQETLRAGGWTDVDTITSSNEPSAGNAGPSGVPGLDPELAGTASTALQAIQFGQR